MAHRLPSRSILVALVAALTSIGCAGSEEPTLELAGDGLLPIAAAKADGRSYFEQFLYRIDESAGTYDSGEPRATYMAASWDDRILLEAADGTSRWTELELWMLADGTAYVVYEEWRRVSGVESVLEGGRIVRTTWSESEDQLLLPGVGVGVAGTNSGVPSIEVTFESDLVTAGIAGQSMHVVRVRTSSRIEHVERDYAAQGS